MGVLPYRCQELHPAVSRRQAGAGAGPCSSWRRPNQAAAAATATAAAGRETIIQGCLREGREAACLATTSESAAGVAAAAAPPPPLPTAGVARSILSSEGLEGGSMMPFLAASEAYWKALRNQGSRPQRVPRAVVQPRPGQQLFPGSAAPSPPAHMYDAVVCGGTLGLFVATALQQRGHKVCLVDKRSVEGRSQEWNISRKELYSLQRLGLLSAQELEQCVVTEFNPVRVGFKGGPQLWVEDCLNLGVSPKQLLDRVKQKFTDAGGQLMEGTEFRGAEVFDDGVRLQLGAVGGGRKAALTVGDTNRPNGVGAGGADALNASSSTDSDSPSSLPDGAPSSQPGSVGGEVLHTQLLLDCMGHYSPIVKQMRGSRRPDGVVMVVGSCAAGFPESSTADLLYTFTDSSQDMQLFWEAFPAEGGAGGARTTYMFCYTDAQPSRPSFEQMLDTYFNLLPQYQGVPLSDLSFKRVLFGAFPCYNDGPLRPSWDRILQVGDSSAAQSPLSFGGFASLLRHLPRLTAALDQALHEQRLSQSALSWVHPYQPSLAAAWLFQRSMSIAVGQLQQQQQEQRQEGGKGGKEGAEQGLPQAQAQPPPPWARLPAHHVNAVLAANFSVMKVLGERVLKPFLQDTIQLLPLTLSMTGMMLRNPLAVGRVLLQVGPSTLISWFTHFFSLVVYTALHMVLRPVMALMPPSVKAMYMVRRFVEALEYGSGLDSHDPPAAWT